MSTEGRLAFLAGCLILAGSTLMVYGINGLANSEQVPQPNNAIVETVPLPQQPLLPVEQELIFPTPLPPVDPIVTGGESEVIVLQPMPEAQEIVDQGQIIPPTVEQATSSTLDSNNQGEFDPGKEIENIFSDLFDYIGSNWNIFIFVFAGLKAILRDKEFQWRKFIPNTMFEFGKLACIENTFELVPNASQIGAGMSGLYLLKSLGEHLTSGEGIYALPKLGINALNYVADIVTSAMSPVSAMINTVQGVYSLVDKYVITPLAKKGLSSAWGWIKTH